MIDSWVVSGFFDVVSTFIYVFVYFFGHICRVDSYCWLSGYSFTSRDSAELPPQQNLPSKALPAVQEHSSLPIPNQCQMFLICWPDLEKQSHLISISLIIRDVGNFNILFIGHFSSSSLSFLFMSKRSTWLYFSNLSAWLESRRREHGRATGHISCWGHCQHCPASCRQSKERQEASEFGLTSQYLILGVHVCLCKGLGVGLKVCACVCVRVCVCVGRGGEDFIWLLSHFLCQDSSEDAPPTTQNFIIPKKEIHTVPDMGKWKRSQVPVVSALWIQAWHERLGLFQSGFLGWGGAVSYCPFSLLEPELSRS